MSPPEKPDSPQASPPRYGRYVGLLALVILVLITVNTLVTKPNGVSGVVPGQQVPPFAVPLVTARLEGDADIATHADQGSAGKVPACELRGPEILNVCAAYERAPLVLALFIQAGSCAHVLDDMQALTGEFPGVRFAAVALKGDRGGLRRLVRSHGLSYPVGIDRDGALLALYKVASCPQLSFVYPGGVEQSRAQLGGLSRAALRLRVSELVQASRVRGGARSSP